MNRADIVNQMIAWIGLNQFDKSNKVIIDAYNTIFPLPRAHKMTCTEPWCATTASAAFHLHGGDGHFPYECSCNKMIAIAKNMGIWVEDDAYIPKEGDCIMYDWNDSGKGDCKGEAEHVGVVRYVEDNKIHVIEGNKNGRCAERVLSVNGRYIRGFITPKFDDGIKKVHTTREITVWSAPAKLDCNRERTVPEGYEITVHTPSFTMNREEWYKTIKDKYVLAKYCI